MKKCKTCTNWAYDKYILEQFTENKDDRVCMAKSGLIQTVCSSEGIPGELITNKDFGCVLHSSGENA
jgi:hypothetical protein